MEKKNKTDRSMIIVEVVIFLVAALLLALYFYADNRLLTIRSRESSAAKMERHYAFISEDTSDMWQSVFDAACEQAAAQKAYMEWIGESSPVAYSAADCMRIATAARVDGIILHKGARDSLTDVIDEASENGIPVITVLEDDEASGRISYIGINSYQMGEQYARQVLRCLKKGSNRVLVISGSPLAEWGALMYSQMVQLIEQEKEEGTEITFEVKDSNMGTSFETEEVIRDIFLEKGNLPDVMVCLDLITTECAAQALVDYNEVGNVSVIGFYASEAVSDAISRGILFSTLGVDASQIGRLGVEALEEYHSLGRVSNYFNIGLSVIDADDSSDPGKQGSDGASK